MTDDTVREAPNVKNARSKQQETLNQLVADPHIAEMYAAYLNERIEMLRRQRMTQNLTLWVPALVGLIGLIGVFVSNYVIGEAATRAAARIDGTLEGRIEKLVDDHLAEDVAVMTERLEKETLLSQLAINAVGLDLSDSVKLDIARNTVDQLAKLEAYPDIRERPEFRYYLGYIVAALTDAGIDDMTQNVIEMYPAELLLDTDATLGAGRFLAQSLLGNALPMERWDDRNVALCHRLLEAMKTHGYPEEALLFEVLLEFRRAGRTTVTERMLAELDDLSETDRSWFFARLIDYHDPRAWVREDKIEERHRRIASTAHEFSATHSEILNPHLDNPALRATLVQLQAGYRVDWPISAATISSVLQNGF